MPGTCCLARRPISAPPRRTTDGTLADPDGIAQARHAGAFRQLEQRFQSRPSQGGFECVFNVLSDGPNLKCLCVDGTVVVACRKAAVARRGILSQGIVRSRGGLNRTLPISMDAVFSAILNSCTPEGLTKLVMGHAAVELDQFLVPCSKNQMAIPEPIMTAVPARPKRLGISE